MPRTAKLPAKPGLKALMGRVNARGLQAVDRRSVAYRAVKDWREKMVAALGGPEAISPQRLSVLELACRTKLFIDHCDAYLVSQPSLVNRRRKSLILLVEQRQRLADALLKHLQALGLDRVEHDLGGLPESWIERVVPRPDTDPEADAPARANGGSASAE